CIQGKEFPLTF
nr:immunoglobulin light chain junction region [Macaca mulatta]